MTRRASRFPEPGAAALAASEQLQALVRARIGAAGGWLPFSAYMQAALYEPGLGYYSGGSTKLGGDGDFVTAPELGAFFACALTVTVAPMLARLRRPAILELGGGTGQLAAQLLTELAAAGIELERYVLLEPSAELRERQRRRLAPFGARIEWTDSLAGLSIDGLVLANEVADAIPVERFRKTRDRVRLLGVEAAEHGFDWALDARAGTPSPVTLDPALVAAWPEGYESEYRPALAAWITALAGVLRRGALVIVDYGMSRREYYHPERVTGTLMCHYRHRAHGDPFLLPGLQDITAWVDFSVCAEAGRAAGLALAAFTPQGGWLLEALSRTPLAARVLVADAAARLKTLVLPGEMGERFKVLALTRGIDGLEVPGRDLSSRL